MSVLLLWLWLTNHFVLLGAEINAEAERQTARDTTTGAEQPIGARGAVQADSTPGDTKGVVNSAEVLARTFEQVF